MSSTSPVPAARISRANDAPIRGDRDHVLYWMTSARRASWNLALDHALWLADDLGKPLVVLEALRAGYEYASDRFHTFVIEGMRDQRDAFAAAGVTYLPYVERRAGDGSGLLAALAARACAVIGDEWPCFFVPRMQRAAADRLDVALELVDGNGLLPLRDLPEVDGAPREFKRAVDFRRHLQKSLSPHLSVQPAADPFARFDLPAPGLLPKKVRSRWQAADLDELLDGGLADLPIDHDVSPVSELPGGAAAAEARLDEFIGERLGRYAEGRNDPDDDMSSGLSPYLHWGHIGAHQVFAAIADHEDWTPDDVAGKATASRSGWWHMSDGAEGFLDQLVTWRELSFHACHLHWPDHAAYEVVPDWARATLRDHADDPREHLYSIEDLAAGRTDDRVWNAAQNELRTTGRMHNYLRMLWGKRTLEWTPSPEDALRVMRELNDRYALDGRDPNSYGGILWVLGRHDRPWGPERPIFGKVRYMTSASTLRKLRLRAYLDRFAPAEAD